MASNLGPVVIKITTTADLRQLDGLINKLNSLQKTLSNVNKSLAETNKQAAPFRKSMQETAKATETINKNLTTATKSLNTFSGAANNATKSLKSTASTMRSGASSAGAYGSAIKSAAEGQRAWRDATKGQKVSYMGTNSAKVMEEQARAAMKMANAIRQIAVVQKALPAGAAKNMRELALVMKEINFVGRSGVSTFMTDLSKAVTAGPQMKMLAAGMVQARMGAIPLASSIREVTKETIALGTGIKNVDNALRLLDGKRNPLALPQGFVMPKPSEMLALPQGEIMTKTFRMLQTQMAALPPVTVQANAAMNKFFNNLNQSVRSIPSNVFGTLMNAIKNIIRNFGQFAASVKSVFNAAAAVLGSFARTAASSFALVQRSINGMLGGIRSFGDSISGHMERAQRSVRDFYNSGWSLLTSGRAFQNVGQNLWGGLTGMFDGYMEFERTAVRTAISASTDIETIQEMIFGLQRGAGGNAPVMQFNAEEMAQGLYYFTSAVGTDLSDATSQTKQDLGAIVGDIMQMAAVTQTGLETATKGVLNAAMEFGIDPRNINESADALRNLAAQFGYLANKTTMEVPDIAEAFKMVGPMAHVLSGDEAGAGLNETFALIGLASDVGLRGGNVGRGINQMLTTILDPSGPAVTAAAEAFGFEASETAFNAFFLNADDTLKGGLAGLFEKLEMLDPSEVASMFTTNASRAIIGMVEAAEDFNDPKFGAGMEGFLKMMEDPEASGKFLRDAVTKNAETISANLQNIKNAWFSITSAIVGAVKTMIVPWMQKFATALFEIGDYVASNPWIGKLVTGLLAVSSVLITVIGSLLMAAGSVLLFLKAFAFMGSLTHLIVVFSIAATSMLLTLAPLLLLVAGAVLFFRRAWEENLYGIQERVAELRKTLEEFFATLKTDGMERINEAFATFQNMAWAAGLAIIDWVNANRAAINEVIRLVKVGARAFLDSFTSMLKILLMLQAAFVKFVLESIGPMAESLRDTVEEVTGVTTSFEDLATLIGGALGSALAVLVFQHFLPMGVIIRAGTLAVKAFTISLTVLGVASGLVSSAISFLTTMMGAAMASLSGMSIASIAASGTVGILTAAISILQIALGAAVFGIAAMTAAMLFSVYQTEGWTGVIRGIVGFLEGMLSVLVPVAYAIYKVGEAIFNLVAALFDANTSQERFILMGQLMAIVLIALAVTAIAPTIIAVGALVAAIISFIAANIIWIAAIGLAIAALYVVGSALADLLGFESVFEMLASGFGYVADAAVMAADAVQNAWGFVIDTVDRATEGTLANTIAQLENQIAVIEGQKPAYMQEKWRFIDTNPMAQELYETEVLDKNIKDAQGQVLSFYDWINMESTQQRFNLQFEAEFAADPRYADTPALLEYNQGLRNQLRALQQDVFVEENGLVIPIKPTWDKGDMSGLPDKKSLTDSLSGVFDSILGAFGVEDLAGMSIEDMLLGEDMGTFLAKYSSDIAAASGGMQLSDILQTEYDKLTTTYTQYADLVDRVGITQANALYEANNIAIPKDPGPYSEWIEGGIDDLEEAEDEYANNLAAFRQSLVTTMQNMDIQGAISAVWGSGSVGSVGLQVFDQIKENLGETAPWMNETEFLADIAGIGMIGDDISGKNIHSALAPALAGIAAETGMTITQILADIPKYIVPDEYVPLATAELTKGIASIGEEAFEQLDEGFGTDIIDQTTGTWATQTGIDWAELTDYAIGQSIAGKDWNLANYMAESWGISVEEAEQYLKDHGIDPGVVSEAWFNDTEMFAQTLGGQVSVMTEEWYNWLGQVTGGTYLADPNIEIDQASFDALPEWLKISLSGQGYTFVITGSVQMTQLDEQTKQDIIGHGGNYNPDTGVTEVTIPGLPSIDAATTEAQLVADAVVTTIDSTITTYDYAGFDTLGTNAATEFKSAFDSALAGWNPQVGGGGGTPTSHGGPAVTGGSGIKIPLDLITFNAQVSSITTMLDTLGLKVVTPTVTLNTGDTFPVLGSLFNILNLLDGKVVTTTIKTVTQTSTQALASGGRVNSDLQLVGEEGPELVSLGQGAYVHDSGSSMRMIQNAVSASNSSAKDSQGEGGGVTYQVTVENITIAKEVDIDKAYARLQALMGQDNAMAQRGMIAFPESKTL